MPTVLLQKAAQSHGRSWFGGSPLLPAGSAWPAWDADDFLCGELDDARSRALANPNLEYWPRRVAELEEGLGSGELLLDFLCQIDLGELPAGHLRETLPNHGLLSVFAAIRGGEVCVGRRSEPTPWQVWWFDDSDKLEVRHRGGTSETMVSPQTRLQAEAGVVIPQLCIVDGQQVLSEYEDEAFEEFIEAMCALGVCGGNQVGGAPYRLQDIREDPREYAALLDAGFDMYNPPVQELAPTLGVRAGQWDLLAQLATDYSDGVSWSGVMTFWRKQGPWSPGRQQVQVHFEDT